MIRVGWPSKWWRAVLLIASFRLAHVNLLWSDEDYHLAAAMQVWQGRVPYRDFWYDKPPLAAYFYALIGGYPGWALRWLDVAFVMACCWVAYRLAKEWWGEKEGRAAALLLAFFTTFYLPAASIPLAVDGLMLLPHLGAMHFALVRRPGWSGLCCGLALLTNVKAVFVTATCALWLGSAVPWFAAGFALPLSVGVLLGAGTGALPGFYVQVWQWGLIYAKGASSPNAAMLGVKHCADWLAFHAALVLGALMTSRDEPRRGRWRLTIWLLFSFAALFFGNHFAPRYFLQLLPVMVMLGARGAVLGLARYGRGGRTALALLLVVPLLRFGPRYLDLVWNNTVGRQTAWSDAAMNLDSQRVAAVLNGIRRPGDTLFVWGYRPDDYVYTRMHAPGLFWDSQPLDGVPADRHLVSGETVLDEAAAANRRQVVQTRPTFIVDGLGMLNPTLAPARFPEIAIWLRGYRMVHQTGMSRIYRRSE